MNADLLLDCDSQQLVAERCQDSMSKRGVQLIAHCDWLDFWVVNSNLGLSRVR